LIVVRERETAGARRNRAAGTDHLALAGLTNREIAETLWITRKTVELHLRGAYGKLGIRSRHRLADVLEPVGAGLVAA
jgi:predicted transcriptional regulator